MSMSSDLENRREEVVMDMEETHQAQQPWEEEVEEEEETALIIRQSKKPPPVNAEVNGGNLHIQIDEEEEEENKANAANNSHNNSVYFDINQGIWKCRHCIWTYQYLFGNGNGNGNGNSSHVLQNLRGNGSVDGSYTAFESSVLEANSKDEEMHFEASNFDNERFLSTEINHHHHEGSVLETNSNDEEMHFEANDFDNERILSTEINHHHHEDSVLETNSNDEEIHFEANDFDIERILSTEINHHHHKDSVDEIFSCSTPSPVNILREEKSTNFEHLDNRTGVDTDVELLDEIDQESTPIDVEKVLENQNTHDLYCPNCHSCITKRVILRRRKRKVRNIRQKLKHDKFEKHSAAAVATDQSDNTLNICSNDSPTPAADDENHDRQTDVFRCLSCFSLFTPTGNGFKLFRIFGDSDENGEVQNVQNIPSSKKNWFFPIFGSDKRKATADKGNSAPEHSEVDGINQHTPSRCSEDMLHDHGSDHPVAPLVDTNPVKTRDPAEDDHPVAPLVDTNPVKTRDPAEDSHIKSQQGNRQPEHSEVDGINQHTSSCCSEDTLPYHGGDHPMAPLGDTNPVKTRDPAENSHIKSEQGSRAPEPSEIVGTNQHTASLCSGKVLPCHGSEHSVAPLGDTKPVKTRVPAEDSHIKSQQGGLESLSSTAESLLLEKPLMAVDRETNMAMGNKAIADHNGLEKPTEGASLQTESLCSIAIVNSVTTEPLETGKGVVTSSAKELIPVSGVSIEIGKNLDIAMGKNNTGDDVVVIIETQPAEVVSSQRAQNVDIPVDTGILPQAEIHFVDNRGAEATEAHQWDILKSIVYGGLFESITSLGVVTSAAAAGTATLDILVMGLANLMGGLIVIAHNLRELKKDHAGETSTHLNTQEDRYQLLLGRKENFLLHATVVVLSYLIFGLMPPVIYGFSFRKTDNRDLKIAAVAGSSLACILLLAVAKVRSQRPPRSYIKTVLYYVSIGLVTSGLTYVAGDLIKQLLEKLNSSFLEENSTKPGWASY